MQKRDNKNIYLALALLLPLSLAAITFTYNYIMFQQEGHIKYDLLLSDNYVLSSKCSDSHRRTCLFNSNQGLSIRVSPKTKKANYNNYTISLYNPVSSKLEKIYDFKSTALSEEQEIMIPKLKGKKVFFGRTSPDGYKANLRRGITSQGIIGKYHKYSVPKQVTNIKRFIDLDPAHNNIIGWVKR